MQEIIELLQLLQSLSPLAVIALLGVVIFMLVKGKIQVKGIRENDLHLIPDVLATLQRIEVMLSSEFMWIRAKLNGRGD